jgi:phosphoglycolate phosphatase-like HAD superfamily hydrolase
MAAGNAGFGAAVAVATGAASYSYLESHPHFRPDYVLASMGELLGLLDRMKAERRT